MSSSSVYRPVQRHRFLLAINRVFVRFKDGAGVTRGATSVAVKTE
jgi:hypothetical protein